MTGWFAAMGDRACLTRGRQPSSRADEFPSEPTIIKKRGVRAWSAVCRDGINREHCGHHHVTLSVPSALLVRSMSSSAVACGGSAPITEPISVVIAQSGEASGVLTITDIHPNS